MACPSVGVFVRTALLVTALAGLGACGGGGETPSGSGEAEVKTGVLTDSAVGGVAYATSSGKSGTTDAQGQFDYVEGDTVTFKLGELELGSVVASGNNATVTPIQLATLAGTTNANKAGNLLVLLQSLDSDGDASNGITIPAAVGSTLTNGVAATLDLTQDPVAFGGGGNAALTGLITAAGGSAKRVGIDAAKAHFKEQFFTWMKGTWYVRHTHDGISDDMLLRVDASGNYILMETGAPDGRGQGGIERGTIHWDPLTGVATAANITVDTSGGWGFSDTVNEVLTLTRAGEQLHFVVDDPETVQNDDLYLSRVLPNGVVGSWGLNDGITFDTAQVFFINNGRFLMYEPTTEGCVVPGMEVGTYSVDAANTVSFTIEIDTNGCGGASDSGPMTRNTETDTLVVTEDSEVYTLYRTGVAGPT